MPGINKRVHWASTPSPPSSISSLPSSPGPLTPPQHSSGPYTYQALPLPGLTPTEVHPALGSHALTTLRWDLTLQPNVETMHVDPRIFTAAVTKPPLPFIIIIVPELGWEIPIQPQGGNPFITVWDVVQGIYRFLREPITQEQYARCNEQQRLQIDASFRRRYTRYDQPQGQKLEKSKGIKKVDLLFGQTRFMGLSSTKRGPDFWRMHFSS
ncbi:hypothetical protein E1B28_009829 [Marasmius oreades]|uniref:DUF6699 domain-containing protein n=1 Tax=Marasmius oreades TaxID=181124 RepID=A0A9P7UT15_9AGAR|nr:uncharacterized protein E1B28_009829 [Marasmius oreades]KAG7090739.1 hypothetical protein E1B28_009829 [Marasmius oreades]